MTTKRKKSLKTDSQEIEKPTEKRQYPRASVEAERKKLHKTSKEATAAPQGKKTSVGKEAELEAAAASLKATQNETKASTAKPKSEKPKKDEPIKEPTKKTHATKRNTNASLQLAKEYDVK